MRATITTQTTIRTPGAEAQCVKELAGSLGVSAHFVYQMRACGFTMRWDARLRTTAATPAEAQDWLTRTRFRLRRGRGVTKG